MRTSFHSQVEVGFVYTCTSAAYCSRVLASEVYEWSLPSTGAREYSMSVSLWLTYLQNTHEWDVASERCRMYLFYVHTMLAVYSTMSLPVPSSETGTAVHAILVESTIQGSVLLDGCVVVVAAGVAVVEAVTITVVATGAKYVHMNAYVQYEISTQCDD